MCLLSSGSLSYIASFYAQDLIACAMLGNSAVTFALACELSKASKRNGGLLNAFQVISSNAIENRVYSAMEPDKTGFDETEIANQKPVLKFESISKKLAEFNGHVGIVAKTQSGKSTALAGMLSRLTGKGNQVVVIDGKGDAKIRGWCKYHCLNSPDKITELSGLLNDLAIELQSRLDTPELSWKPFYLVIDEINCLRMNAEFFDKSLLQEFDRQFTLLLLQGASAKMFVRFSTHTSRVSDLGLNTGILDSISWLSLGRNKRHESLNDLIQYQVAPHQKRSAQDSLLEYEATYSGVAPVCLSLLDGLEVFVGESEEESPTRKGDKLHSFVGESGLSRGETNRAGETLDPLTSGGFPQFPLSNQGAEILRNLGSEWSSGGSVSSDTVKSLCTSNKQYSGVRRMIQLLFEENP